MQQFHRQVVLDTETTGLDPQNGHRIIEIGCVEMIDRRLTGKHFHVYLNPQRLVEEEAIKVHGITNEFLQDKPAFADIVEDYVAFTEGAELIIHNAPFDVGFLDHELAKLTGETRRTETISEVFDTLVFARNKFPGARNSLDALCKRYAIDNSHRELHGALLDAEILAEVYLAMTGGQASLWDDLEESDNHFEGQLARLPENRPPLRVIACSPEELEAHEKHLNMIREASGRCLWQQED